MEFMTRPELTGHFGMVASTHYLGSAAGMAVLEAGGNAFDAAVATGFVLQVVEPHLNGPGGDMSLLFAAADGPATVLCGQGPAPAGATIDAYAALGLTEIPGSGLTAAAVPGSTVAWLTLLRDHGTMALADVLQYAITYATKGYPVLPQIATTIAAVEQLLTEHWTDTAAQYLPAGRPPRAGTMLTNSTLADTYRRLVAAASRRDREAGIDAAIEAWRNGFVAEAVDMFFRQPARDSSGRDNPGFVTGYDLATWRPAYEQPATIEFGPYTIAKTGPWGQGPVLLQQLAVLDGLRHDPMSAAFVHTIVEGAKLAFADRNAYYGDSAPVPLQTLLSADYATERRALITDRADLDLRPGHPDGLTPTLPRTGTTRVTVINHDGAAGEPTVPTADGRTRGDTCHVDVVDRWGNLVSATPSGGWLQSSPIIPALGFPLGTRLQMMELTEGLPTTLIPGRRPRTTLSPTLVMQGGRAVLACGTPGGDQQDQWQTPFLLRHLVHGWGLQRSIDAPNFHTNHVPGSFYPHEAHCAQLLIEDRFDEAVFDDLRDRGHEVVTAGPWALGRLSAVRRDPATGVLSAGANPRGMQGYAVGR